MSIKSAALFLLVGLSLSSPAQAGPSTAKGEISVSQVVELIERAPTDNGARNAAMAYLAGVGESTGAMMAEIRQLAPEAIKCARPLAMSSPMALAALSGTDKEKWDETAATPILVDDMLKRAGCR